MHYTELPEDFDRQADNILKIDSLLEEIGLVMLQDVEERFLSESGPDGSPWSSDLVDTGELRDSFTISISNNSVGVEPSGVRNEDIVAIQEDKGNIIMGFSDACLEEIDRLLDNYLSDVVES